MDDRPPGALKDDDLDIRLTKEQDSRALLDWLLAMVGAVVGGVVGSLVFVWLLRRGILAVALPGALVGVGCGMLSGRRSRALGIVCGVAGMLLGFLLEWRYIPFIADDSLSYFLTHIHELDRLHLLFIALGALAAFWFGLGRRGGAWPRRRRR